MEQDLRASTVKKAYDLEPFDIIVWNSAQASQIVSVTGGGNNDYVVTANEVVRWHGEWVQLGTDQQTRWFAEVTSVKVALNSPKTLIL